MANIIFMSDGVAGLGITPVATTSLYDGVKSGTVGVQTTIKEHGYGSFDHNSAASASAYIARLACLADAGRRISVRMRFDALPASNTGIIRPLSGTATVAEVRLNSAGKLLLYAGASGAALQATGATTLSTATWYQISLAYTITNASVSEWRVYLNGVLELTASNPASQVTGSDNLRIGWTGTSPGSNKHMYHQDLYIDDSTALTDPGDIRVTNKVPAGTGTNNAFDTQGGVFTNRWDGVSERPATTTKYWQHANTSSVIEEYSVQAAAVGDDDLTGKSILGWAPWVNWAVFAAAGTTINMVANGSLVAVTSINASTLYQSSQAIVASTSYPSTDAVGLQSTGSSPDTLLGECGVFIAYTASAPVNVTSPLATITGQSYVATMQVRINAANTTGTLAAIAPTITNIGAPINVTSPLATISGQSYAATIQIRVNGATATGAFSAIAPSVNVRADVIVPVATISGQAYAATIQLRVNAQTTTGAFSAIAPTVAIISDVVVPVATISGQSYAATIQIRVKAAATNGLFAAIVPVVSFGGTGIAGQFSATLFIDRAFGGALHIEDFIRDDFSIELSLGGALSIGDPWEALMYTEDAWKGDLEVGDS